MRLIDADELKKKKKHSQEFAENVVSVAEIDWMPTIDPLKHGHWIEMTVSSGMDSWKCSLCGRRARGNTNNLPYCHCGAKMDEKIDL